MRTGFYVRCRVDGGGWGTRDIGDMTNNELEQWVAGEGDLGRVVVGLAKYIRDAVPLLLEPSITMEDELMHRELKYQLQVGTIVSQCKVDRTQFDSVDKANLRGLISGMLVKGIVQELKTILRDNLVLPEARQ